MRARTLPLLVPALGGLVLLGGCLKRTKISETYVLDPVAARDAASPSLTPEAVVGVLKVTVPGWIDRPQVTGRSSTGQILTDEFARWGEPVAKGVQRVVAENLAALLPTRRIVVAPFSPNQVVHHRVDITLSEAARQADGSVLVEARWALLGPRGATLVQRRTSHRAHPTAAGAAGAVTGASEAIAELSREIAGALRALPLPPAARTSRPASSPGGSLRRPGGDFFEEPPEDLALLGGHVLHVHPALVDLPVLFAPHPGKLPPQPPEEVRGQGGEPLPDERGRLSQAHEQEVARQDRVRLLGPDEGLGVRVEVEKAVEQPPGGSAFRPPRRGAPGADVMGHRLGDEVEPRLAGDPAVVGEVERDLQGEGRVASRSALRRTGGTARTR